MIPKARIYQEKGSWSISVVHPLLQRVEVYSDIPTLAQAIQATEHYRGTFLSAIAKLSAAGQRGLVH